MDLPPYVQELLKRNLEARLRPRLYVGTSPDTLHHELRVQEESYSIVACKPPMLRADTVISHYESVPIRRIYKDFHDARASRGLVVDSLEELEGIIDPETEISGVMTTLNYRNF